MDKYLLVKGGLDDLTPKFQKNLIGLGKNQMNFTALIPADKKHTAGRNVLFEKPSIDDIVVFHIKGMRR
jgi:ABC-2 type transport system ATP-binding protein